MWVICKRTNSNERISQVIRGLVPNLVQSSELSFLVHYPQLSLFNSLLLISVVFSVRTSKSVASSVETYLPIYNRIHSHILQQQTSNYSNLSLHLS